METIKVLSVVYNRNGVSGEGFFLVKFISDTDGTLLGLVFNNGTMSVINPTDQTQQYKVEFFSDFLAEAVMKNR